MSESVDRTKPSPLTVDFGREDWDHARRDSDLLLLLSQHFRVQRRKLAPTQSRFVDLAKLGALPSLGGEKILIGEKDVQRIEQGRPDLLSYERFSLLCRCLGVSAGEMLRNVGYEECREQMSVGAERSLPSAKLLKGRRLTQSISQMGESFSVRLSETQSQRRLFALPNPDPHSLRFLNWQTFGEGIEVLAEQIRNVGYHIHVDACIGINDAGLVMATFLNQAVLKRTHLGHIRCGMYRNSLQIDHTHSILPDLSTNPALMICDFETKYGAVLPGIVNALRSKYGDPTIFFSVFGAMTEKPDLRIKSLDDLVSAKFLVQMNLQEIFVACTMHPPGIEPPLDLK